MKGILWGLAGLLALVGSMVSGLAFGFFDHYLAAGSFPFVHS